MARSSLPATKSRPSGSRKEASSSASPSLESKLAGLYVTLSSTSDLNALIDLIQLIREHVIVQEDAKHSIALRKAIQFLTRSMQALLGEGRISIDNVSDDGLVILSASSSNGPADAVMQWLQTRWNDVITLFCHLLSCHDEQTRTLALTSLMDLQRDASSALTRSKSLAQSQSTEKKNVRAQWSRSPWRAIMSALVMGPSETDSSNVPDAASAGIVYSDVVRAFTDAYLQEYDDVRFAFCRYAEEVLRSRKKASSVSANVRQNILQLLLGLTAIPTKPQHLNTFLVKEIEGNERLTRKSEKTKKGGSTGDEDGDDAEEEPEDWFSDSDEEDGSAKKDKPSSVSGLGKAAQSAADAHSARRRLKRNPAFCDAVYSLSAQRAAFSRAWLAVLLPSRDAKDASRIIGGPLDEVSTHEALMRMHTQIMPHLSKPNMLHDFLVDALDAGGATALLALNTLFTLMTKHNLNYPAFYTRLYALLQADPPVLHVRYRSRFLRLLDVFLGSTHLPATLVASFAKRLSRIALRAPPSAIVVVLPFVWNLCKRHKHCLGLVHREFSDDRFDAGPIGFVDPFDATEPDPLKTNAIESSLWELAAMGSLIGAAQQQASGDDDVLHSTGTGRAHYLASVSSLSRILSEPFTKERYGLEDFLDLTYATMFDTEIGKTLKKRPGKPVVDPATVFDLPRQSDGKRARTFGSQGQEDASANGVPTKKAKLLEGEEEEEATKT